MTDNLSPHWPVLCYYDQDHLARIALPLGGIGTGTVSLGGRGDLRDWEIMNRPAKGFVPLTPAGVGPFFALWVASQDGRMSMVRALEGPLGLEEYEGSHGSPAPNHGLPRFRRCAFAAAYPLGQVLLSDPDVPLLVRIEAFNPLIPGDTVASGIPVAVLRFVLSNPDCRSYRVAVCGSIPNFIGVDGSQTTLDWGHRPVPTGARANRNTFREAGRLRGIYMHSLGVDQTAEQWGTIALVTTSDAAEVSFRTAWANLQWGNTLLDFWDDFIADGALEDRPVGWQDMPIASLAVRTEVQPHAQVTVLFLLTWHFPNRYTWTPQVEDVMTENASGCGGGTCKDPNWVGNYYTTIYRDAWHVAEEVVSRLSDLETATVQFVRTVCESTLPEAVKEAALFNLSTLRTQTCFRTADGRFFGWEGCFDHVGCCHGSCTHVWNYEQATAFLFGDLARSMRETEFLYATRDDGLMSFRVNLPLSHATDFGFAAADGQMGCLMRLYREWQLSGDDAFLRRLWPKARKALEFCWVTGGWDADRDGVMEGCQHNTMDVEYFGPNPQMAGWYLGALRAVEEMARYLGDQGFAAECRALFERGSEWIDQHLFNGEYYEHEIRPIASADQIAPGLRVGMGSADVQDPDLQLGAGCLVDQLVGQYMAHICGLGYVLDPAHVRTTLQNIFRYNFRQSFHDHFNSMRSFVLGDEAGLLMATYPHGRRPTRPFPYFTEVMTGFEYVAAVGMLYEGLLEEGIRCIQAIRARYDGRKRNPFNEAECGHHYARAMASWAAILALSGFSYSAVSQTLELAPRWQPFEFRCVWSMPMGWGEVEQAIASSTLVVCWRVRGGNLAVRRMRYRLPSEQHVHAVTVTVIGEGDLPIRWSEEGGWVGIELLEAIFLREGQSLNVQVVFLAGPDSSPC